MRHIFIINPAAGKKNITDRVRKEIDGVCARRGIHPLVFISEYNGYERFIAEKMCSLFIDEDIRFTVSDVPVHWFRLSRVLMMLTTGRLHVILRE